MNLPINPEVARFLRENMPNIRRGRGEILYRNFVDRFPMFSTSYLTDELLHALKTDDVISLFNHTIPENAFKFTEVENVFVPDKIQEIGSFAFSDCTNLRSISLPSALKFGAGICRECENLVSAEIRTGPNATGYRMFSGCASLQTVQVDCAVISENAFTGNSYLTDFIIGTNVKILEDALFRSCIRLSQITYLGTKAEWDNIDKSKDWNKYSGIYRLVCSDGEFDIKIK